MNTNFRESGEAKCLLPKIQMICIASKKFHLKGIELQALLPVIDEYMTYEGSLPFPSCAETVTWIILNRSIQISSKERQFTFLHFTDCQLWEV
ncbi:hypothetical protein ACTXT7_000065 [Hymenolepis weldensis]